jgi:hypothetical protein
MQTANPVAAGTPQGAAGAGELDAYSASRVTSPINPNVAMNAFVGSDPSGKKSLNPEAWAKAVIADPTAWGSSAAGQAWGSAWGTASGSAWGTLFPPA